ncbi:U2 small nuclear ribonucleoprotein B'' [Blyttiomyces sp. JEL0837]|nr:U2 small nuclear ribonucleoprotein B'' [Blyttiomyces sp. JEL0837]
MATIPPPAPNTNTSFVVPGLGVSVMTAARRRPLAPPPTEPNRTLYIRNLNEKVSLKVLKTALETLFSTFGDIVEIRAQKNLRMRGQAFITYKDQDSATKAMREIQGFPLFALPMDIQYARDTSLLFSKENGTYEEHKRKREEEKIRRAQEPKKPKTEAPTIGATGWFPGGAPMPAEFLPPNNILFVENLPPETTNQILTELFQQLRVDFQFLFFCILYRFFVVYYLLLGVGITARFAGFREVRLVPGKSDIAFVEYETETQSTLAKQQLNQFKITPEREIKVTFARK